MSTIIIKGPSLYQILLSVIVLVFCMMHNARGAIVTGDADRTISLVGSGASSTSLLWDMVTFVYQGVNAQVRVKYTPSNSDRGVQDLLEKRVDYAGSDVLTDHSSHGVRQLPIAGEAVAFAYNIPDLSSVLVLDELTLFGIFAGNISSWNHPRLVALNPELATVAHDIVIVYRSGGSGTNVVFASALEQFGQTGLSPNPANWPFALQGRGIVTKESGDIGPFVRNRPYALGYVAHPFVLGQPVAALINTEGGAGAPVLPSNVSVAKAISSPRFGNKLLSTYINGDDANAYPIVTMTYVLYYEDMAQDCLNVLSLAELLYWLTTSDLATDVMNYLNYAPVTNLAASALPIQQLTNMKCNGILAYNYLLPFEVVLLGLCSFLAVICAILFILLLATRSKYRNTQDNKLIEIGGDLLAKIAAFLSVNLWLGYPVDWICKTRPFIVFLASPPSRGISIIINYIYLFFHPSIHPSKNNITFFISN
eukprot:TRINITY_DN1095_c0_g1_i1.p1 TRINITY_DN1095_c0_g1~~TRINITY_DN1095_c0_g1_i1.p1  ORF type:complete len:480 (+),score=73.22 TRINITY_DN1095_c0_g1_i1:32-1471(+)